MRILLIEDDQPIAEFVSRGLQEADLDIECVTDGTEGLRLATIEQFDLIILDLMLPGTDGWEICRAVRLRRNPVPILMLTARDAVEDRVRGLNVGADDYLPKPFDFSELLARVRALLRRDKLHKGGRIQIADLVIDSMRRSVTRAGHEVVLTPREFSLLEALARSEGEVLTREMITERVWRNDMSFSNTVDVHIGSLRKKIDADHPKKLLHTIHRIGYMLRDPDAVEEI
ncbi:MAG TPA: response regulator transcription factor [Chthonomonadaceae bacterium]|nr:response regulator transcription factor [Chthonomonadaceae bacterium]